MLWLLCTDCLDALLSMLVWCRRLTIALAYENKVGAKVPSNSLAPRLLARTHFISFELIPKTIQICQPQTA